GRSRLGEQLPRLPCARGLRRVQSLGHRTREPQDDARPLPADEEPAGQLLAERPGLLLSDPTVCGAGARPTPQTAGGSQALNSSMFPNPRDIPYQHKETKMSEMTAAVVEGFGQELVVGDNAIPEPGPGQALVKLIASGVCHTDLHASQGDWPVKPKIPLIPGHEGVGTVEK